MITYLPPELLKDLNCTQVKALYFITGLMVWHGKHSTSGAQYWNSGQAWLSNKIGVSRPWLSTCIQILHAKGLLTKIHRRREKGQWKTNLYKLGPEIVRIFKGTKASIAAWVDHVKCSRHKVIKTVSNLKDKGIEGVLRTPFTKNKEDPREYFNSLLSKYGTEGK
jgi:biotin operon repressor